MMPPASGAEQALGVMGGCEWEIAWSAPAGHLANCSWKFQVLASFGKVSRLNPIYIWKYASATETWLGLILKSHLREPFLSQMVGHPWATQECHRSSTGQFHPAPWRTAMVWARLFGRWLWMGNGGLRHHFLNGYVRLVECGGSNS